MNSKYWDLSEYRMNKAKEDCSAAQLLLLEGMIAQSLNRSYYAIFHATRSLLALDSFDSKKHSGVISYFNRNYIKAGKLGKELSKIIKSAQQIRNESDYDDFYIAIKEDAIEQIEKSKEFIEVIDEYRQKKYASI